MRNLTGYLLKILLLFSIVLSPLLLPSNAFAASNDLVKKLSIEYSLNDKGDMSVVYRNTLTKSVTYPTIITNYSYTIPVTKYDRIEVSLNGKSIKHVATSISGGYKIYLTLSNTVISKDSPAVIDTNVTINSFAAIESENTHIVLPTLNDSQIVSAVLKIPTSFSDIVWSNFKYKKSSSGELKIYTLSDFSGGSISLVLGKSIGHTLEINKDILNDSDIPTIYKITLPREGDGQIVVYNSITPTPYDVDIDEDKNLSFSYLVESKASLKINIHAYIAKDGSQNTAPKSFESFLTTDKYWAFSNDTELKRVKLYLRNNGIENQETDKMSKEQFSAFVASINKYVVDRYKPIESDGDSLSYQFSRLGVANAESLSNNGATSDDYTDLAVSLLRAYNVPSRMVLGYVSELNSYSSTGFFHSWAEYWDANVGKWVMIDPSLQDYYPTSYYETNFDHITMVVRTSSSFSPDSSIFSSDEFKLKVATSSTVPIHLIESKVNDFTNLLSKYEGSLEIENMGNTIMFVGNLKLKTNNREIEPSNIINTQVILPGQVLTQKLIFDNINSVKSPQLLLTLRDLNDNSYKYPQSIESSDVAESDRLINLGISFIIFLVLTFIIRFVFSRKKKK